MSFSLYFWGNLTQNLVCYFLCWIPSSVLWLFGLNAVLSRGLLETSPAFLCGLA